MDSVPAPVALPRTEALLYALTVERGRCRNSSEALQNASETILTLEAQLARREAELESRDLQDITDVKPIPRKHSIVEALHPDLPEVSLSEVVHSLNVAVESNLVLEQGIGESNSRVNTPLLHNSLTNSVFSIRGPNIIVTRVSPRLQFRLRPKHLRGFVLSIVPYRRLPRDRGD